MSHSTTPANTSNPTSTLPHEPRVLVVKRHYLLVRWSHWLGEAFADEDLRNNLIQVVQQLDARPISDLMDLLAQVQRTAVFARTHPGIQ